MAPFTSGFGPGGETAPPCYPGPDGHQPVSGLLSVAQTQRHWSCPGSSLRAVQRVLQYTPAASPMCLGMASKGMTFSSTSRSIVRRSRRGCSGLRSPSPGSDFAPQRAERRLKSIKAPSSSSISSAFRRMMIAAADTPHRRFSSSKSVQRRWYANLGGESFGRQQKSACKVVCLFLHQLVTSAVRRCAECDDAKQDVRPHGQDRSDCGIHCLCRQTGG